MYPDVKLSSANCSNFQVKLNSITFSTFKIDQGSQQQYLPLGKINNDVVSFYLDSDSI